MTDFLDNEQALAQSGALLKIVAEELKLPLTYIVRRLELARMSSESQADALEEVEASAAAALRLMDSYMLGVNLFENKGMFELEPVSVSAALYDTAHSLDKLAKGYEVDLQLQIGQLHSPVMAHPAGLRAALFSLGYAVIQSQSGADKHQAITLSAGRAHSGVVAGLYGGMPMLSTAHLNNACRLYTKARQPFNQLSGSSAAGVFVAHKILQAMDGRLRVGHRHKETGLAAILPASSQLQLVGF